MNSQQKQISYGLIFILLLITSPCFSQSKTGTITGRITDTKGEAIENANIVILNSNFGTASDDEGKFFIDSLPPGEYELKFLRIGFQEHIIKKIVLKANQNIELNVQLQKFVLPMQEIVVTPGNFSIAQNQPATGQAIEKERITSLPATLDDICRVLQIMPGVSFSDDFSAHFHVRGGKQSENLILLDGIEIFDPYHLKDVGGAVGVMNLDLIDDVAILTGGFPAKYGDKLSSVVTMKNRIGVRKKFRGNLGAGGTGLSLVLESPIPSGSWIFSVRKSFLKEAVRILNPTDYSFSPSFFDVQSKISLRAGQNNQITYNLLYSKDNSYLERWRGDVELYSDYGNSYHGLVWNSIMNPKLSSEFIISKGQNFWDNKIGTDKEEKLNLTEYVFNWNLNLLPNQIHDIEAGLTYKYILYDYELKVAQLSKDQQNLEDLVESYYGDLKIAPKTYKFSVYLQDKLKIFESLYTNCGIRYDYFEYNKDQQLSPRISIAYHLTKKTIFRAAWGKYYQAPGYTELTHTKGAEPNPKAEQATHYVIGVEHAFSDKFNLRVESYLKLLDNMIGHYFRISNQSTYIELCYGNPNEGRCRGIEFFLDGKLSDRCSIWATYAYSQTRLQAYFVNWDEMKIEQRTFPRFTDQPHNLSLFFNYKLPKAWELNVKWRYLSGTPFTPQYPIWLSDTPEWESGEFYSARYPAYHRLDFRFGKTVELKKMKLRMFLEIKNIYNHHNIFVYDYTIENDTHVKKAYYSLPFLPTIELNLAF